MVRADMVTYRKEKRRKGKRERRKGKREGEKRERGKEKGEKGSGKGKGGKIGKEKEMGRKRWGRRKGKI